MAENCEKRSVLFVCIGNSCRSPTAEAVFKSLVKERNLEHQWTADSAAIQHWNVGRPAEPRAISTLKAHGMKTDHIGRQIIDEDFINFDFIFGMDEDNIHDLEKLKPKDNKAVIGLLGEYDPEGDRIIPDPYFQRGTAGFEKAYQQSKRCCQAFLDKHSRK